MAKITAPFNEPSGKSLTKYVIDLIKLAKEKGFPYYEELQVMVSTSFWRKKEVVFCAIVCAAIQTWLRERHKFDVWVEPVVPGRYKGFFNYFLLRDIANEHERPIDENYEMHFISALDFALNALPPTNDTSIE